MTPLICLLCTVAVSIYLKNFVGEQRFSLMSQFSTHSVSSRSCAVIYVANCTWRKIIEILLVPHLYHCRWSGILTSGLETRRMAEDEVEDDTHGLLSPAWCKSYPSGDTWQTCRPDTSSCWRPSPDTTASFPGICSWTSRICYHPDHWKAVSIYKVRKNFYGSKGGSIY